MLALYLNIFVPLDFINKSLLKIRAVVLFETALCKEMLNSGGEIKKQLNECEQTLNICFFNLQS